MQPPKAGRGANLPVPLAASVRWFIPRRHLALPSALLLLGLAIGADPARAQDPSRRPAVDPITGVRSRLIKDWIGLISLPATTPILVMAGHADSQGVGGAGTSGAAVALRGQRRMDPSMTDELFWNLRLAQAVVALGQTRGLDIRFYDPPERSIANPNDPRTTWSVGREFVAAGGYALEIHHDAYGPDGVGSGLIPPLRQPLSRLHESLAEAFGAYPFRFRDGLGAPKRGIAILEIGKLEAPLESALRNPRRSQEVINLLAERVVAAIVRGLAPAIDPDPVARQLNGTTPKAAPVQGASSIAADPLAPEGFSPGPGGAGSDRPENRPRTSSEGG